MALSPEQRRVLRQITAAPSYARATPKVRKALIEAALVESNLATPNQANSDRDSEGVLQQRPSQGWGPTSESNTQDAEQFLRRAIPLRGQYGSSGALAQAVQRSAYPGRYNQRGGDAAAILRGLGGDVNALVGDGGGHRTTGRGTAGEGRGFTTRGITVSPAVDNAQARREALVGFLLNSTPQASPDPTAAIPGLPGLPGLTSGGGGGTDILGLALQMRALQDQPAVRGTVQVPTGGGGGARAASAQGRPAARAASARGSFKIAGPNPGRIQPKVRNFLRELSAVAGETIVGSDGTGHSKYTVNGNVSEHFTGSATDIPAKGAHLTRLGQRALITAGMSPEQARKVKGGLFNVNRGGRRYQIIFNTMEGGNHFDHLHVGVR